MKRINNILPHAMKALKDSGLIFPDQKSILKEYDGYVASFSPSVRTAGLRATLSFYSDKHKDRNDNKPKRNHILNCLLVVYQKMDTEGGILPGSDLLDIALNTTNEAKLRQLKKDLTDCAIALKLVLRNFEQLDEVPKPAPTN